MQLCFYLRNNFTLIPHDQTGWNEEMEGKYGYVEVNKEGAIVTHDKTENISFLISMKEDGLGYVWAKNKGTKRFHMQTFFKSYNNYIKNNLNKDTDKIIHLLDNFSGTKNKDFYDLIKKEKIKIAFQPP